MATFDITVGARSGVGDGTSGSVNFVPPGDFDGATINDVSVVGTPSLTSDSTTDDTISVYWYIADALTVATYGGNSLATSICSATLGDGVASDTIADEAGTSPAPSTAVAADWDIVIYRAVYTASMKDDAETCSWLSFTIRVTYTPAAPSTGPNLLTLLGVG